MVLLTCGAAALALAAWVFLRPGEQGGAASRPLSRYRVERLPPHLPVAWQEQLAAALAAAPEMDLAAPGALDAARRVLQEVPWIDATALHLALDLPRGLRASFEPRLPYLMVQVGERSHPVDPTGVLLPPGLSAEQTAGLPVVLLDSGAALPEPGRAVADSLVQEALRAGQEFYSLRKHSGLDLVLIERMPGYPKSAPHVPPALAFTTRDGVQLCWGRSEAAQDPLGIPLELKVRRLKAVMLAYPRLQGVGRVFLDDQRLKVMSTDLSRELPLEVPGQ